MKKLEILLNILNLKSLIRLAMLKSKKGFSLVELLVVIGIIGVLAGIALPSYRQYKDKANKAGLKASAKAFAKAVDTCMLDSVASACNTFDELGITCTNCSSSTTTDNNEPVCGFFGNSAAGHYAVAVQVPLTGKINYQYSSNGSTTAVTCADGTGAITGGTTDETSWGKRKGS